MPTPSDRPLRYCDVCGELDDHPRHRVNVPPGTPGAVPTSEFLDALPPGPAPALAQLLDPATVIRHMNCCADAGCLVCQATEAAAGGARGQELIEAITVDGVLDDVDVSDIPLNVEAI